MASCTDPFHQGADASRHGSLALGGGAEGPLEKKELPVGRCRSSLAWRRTKRREESFVPATGVDGTPHDNDVEVLEVPDLIRPEHVPGETASLAQIGRLGRSTVPALNRR